MIHVNLVETNDKLLQTVMSVTNKCILRKNTNKKKSSSSTTTTKLMSLVKFDQRLRDLEANALTTGPQNRFPDKVFRDCSFIFALYLRAGARFRYKNNCEIC